MIIFLLKSCSEIEAKYIAENIIDLRKTGEIETEHYPPVLLTSFEDQKVALDFDATTIENALLLTYRNTKTKDEQEEEINKKNKKRKKVYEIGELRYPDTQLDSFKRMLNESKSLKMEYSKVLSCLLAEQRKILDKKKQTDESARLEELDFYAAALGVVQELKPELLKQEIEKNYLGFESVILPLFKEIECDLLKWDEYIANLDRSIKEIEAFKTMIDAFKNVPASQCPDKIKDSIATWDNHQDVLKGKKSIQAMLANSKIFAPQILDIKKKIKEKKELLKELKNDEKKALLTREIAQFEDKEKGLESPKNVVFMLPGMTRSGTYFDKLIMGEKGEKDEKGNPVICENGEPTEDTKGLTDYDKGDTLYLVLQPLYPFYAIMQKGFQWFDIRSVERPDKPAIQRQLKKLVDGYFEFVVTQIRNQFKNSNIVAFGLSQGGIAGARAMKEIPKIDAGIFLSGGLELAPEQFSSDQAIKETLKEGTELPQELQTLRGKKVLIIHNEEKDSFVDSQESRIMEQIFGKLGAEEVTFKGDTIYNHEIYDTAKGGRPNEDKERRKDYDQTVAYISEFLRNLSPKETR